MTAITLYCRGGMARARVEGPVTAGMVGIPVSVECDEAWEGLTKTLKVRCAQVVRQVILDGENRATLPFECLMGGQKLECGLDGWDSGWKLRIPTNWAFCGVVKPSVADIEGTEGAEPTPGITEQLMLRLEAVEKEIAGIKNGVYSGEYQITPTPEGFVLPTAKKLMEDNLTVRKIPYFEVSNPSGGKTVYIGKADEISIT